MHFMNNKCRDITIKLKLSVRGSRCRDRMIVGFTITYAIGAYLSPLMLWVQLPPKARCTTLCDKVSDLRQFDCFLRVLRFPPQIILLKVENHPFKQPKTIPLIGMGITRKETK